MITFDEAYLRALIELQGPEVFPCLCGAFTNPHARTCARARARAATIKAEANRDADKRHRWERDMREAPRNKALRTVNVAELDDDARAAVEAEVDRHERAKAEARRQRRALKEAAAIHGPHERITPVASEVVPLSRQREGYPSRMVRGPEVPMREDGVGSVVAGDPDTVDGEPYKRTREPMGYSGVVPVRKDES